MTKHQVRTLPVRAVGERKVSVQGRTYHLPDSAPRPGTRLEAAFAIPGARNARAPLTAGDFAVGLTLVSTLPNIEKNACAMQIVHLEEHAYAEFPGARVVHVSSDDAENWEEVDEFHGNLTAAGYTLADASDDSRAAFCAAFGVGVRESRRIAHGLFALRDGVFVAAVVPEAQMETPDIHAFLRAVTRALAEG
jgi:peroxiredoxin